MPSLSTQELTRLIQEALKSKDQRRVAVLRLLLTSIRNTEVEKRRELTEEEQIDVVQREVKKRQEAADDYAKGGRQDRADAEIAEAEILKQWLPEQISRDELERLIGETIAETGAASSSEMGRVMGALMPKIKGRADAKLASEMVKARLSES